MLNLISLASNIGFNDGFNLNACGGSSKKMNCHIKTSIKCAKEEDISQN